MMKLQSLGKERDMYLNWNTVPGEGLAYFLNEFIRKRKEKKEIKRLLKNEEKYMTHLSQKHQH